MDSAQCTAHGPRPPPTFHSLHSAWAAPPPYIPLPAQRMGRAPPLHSTPCTAHGPHAGQCMGCAPCRPHAAQVSFTPWGMVCGMCDMCYMPHAVRHMLWWVLRAGCLQ